MDELEEELEAISQLVDAFEMKYAASITCIPEFTDSSSYASSSEEEDDAIPNNEYEPVVADKRISQSSVKDDQNIAAREEFPGVLGSKSSRKRTKSNQKSKHPMLPPCNGKCTRSCKYISKERRKAVYEGYWAKNELQRTEFISQRVTEYDKKTSRPRSSSKERNKSRTYSFKDDKAKVVQVCQQYFLSTLGYKRSHVVDWIFKKHGGNAVADSRGSHAPKHKMSVRTEKAILEHIESFHPAVSHYRRKHAPLRRYLPPTLNVRKMHDLFTELQRRK